MQEIRTKNLLVRCMQLSDAYDIFAYASDPEVSRYTQWSQHTTIDDTYAFLASTTAYMHLKQTIILGIELVEEKKIIGECGFIHMTHQHAELYYALSKNYWGKGYATEALMALVNFGFYSMEFERIEAWIIAPNSASHKVAQKIGMNCNMILYNHWYADDTLYDIHVYTKENPLIKPFYAEQVLPSDTLRSQLSMHNK